ncbi:MAG: hypothetical protein AAB407_01180 [Patescibacteria group bacterium]
MNRSIAITLALVTILTVFGQPLLFPRTVQKAEAAVPVWDITGAPVQSFTQSLLEWAWRFARETLRRRILDMMVDQIIQWINGGGKPQFVSDWGGFLDDAANIAIGDFAEEIGAGWLCDPFNFQIQIALLPVPRFSQQVTCTLDQIVGNIDNFYNDFRNGNWIAYTGSLEPQNNYFGATILAISERDRRISQAQQSAQNEALAGGGFLSSKSCNESGGSGPDLDGDGTPGDISSTCVVTTPGSTVGGIVSKAIGSDIDYLVNAEEIEAYVGAIANAIVNRLIVSGVNGLKGVSTPNAPAGGTIGGGSGPCAGLVGVQLTACQDYVTTSNNNLDFAKSSTISNINQVLSPLQGVTTAHASSLQALNQYVADLNTFLSQFNALPSNPFMGKACTNFDTYIANINAELGYATSTIAIVTSKQSANQAWMGQLNTSVQGLNALAPDDWAGFSAIVAPLQNSGLLDQNAAITAENNAATELQTIQTHIQQAKTAIQNNYTSCQNGN